jgi:hypothetical protein
MPCSTLRIAIRPYAPSENGVSMPGVPGTEVGAVEYPPPDELDEYELSKFLGELADAKLTQDKVPLVPPYGLLVARLRPNCLRDEVEEIRCRLCFSLAFPLSFAGGSIGIASECSIGMSEELAASRTASGRALAMAEDAERSRETLESNFQKNRLSRGILSWKRIVRAGFVPCPFIDKS